MEKNAWSGAEQSVVVKRPKWRNSGRKHCVAKNIWRIMLVTFGMAVYMYIISKFVNGWLNEEALRNM